MQAVLGEIDDGVIILEEQEQEQDYFTTVEFANSFVQLLFGSDFKTDAPASAEQVKRLAKKPTLFQTSENVLNTEDIDKIRPPNSTSLLKLMNYDVELRNDSRQNKGLFIVRVPEGIGESSDSARMISSGRNMSVN